MSLLTIFLAPHERFPSSCLMCFVPVKSQEAFLFPLQILSAPRGHPSSWKQHKALCVTQQDRAHLHWSTTVTSFPMFLKPHVRQRKAWRQTLQILPINKYTEKTIPRAENLFICSIQKILMTNCYTDEEKQWVQGLFIWNHCSNFFFLASNSQVRTRKADQYFT